MRVRGERECVECGTRWSYYETGDVACPDCGSVHSVSTNDERREQTDAAPTLDLDDAVLAASRDDYRGAAERAREAARDYAHRVGFVRGGRLRELDDAALAAWELRYAASAFARGFDHTEAEEYYFVSLLRGAPSGDRPAPADVPASMRAARGNGYADAVADYRDDLRRVRPDGRDGLGALLESLDAHVRRIHALDGDVPPADADALVGAARAIGRYARDGDESDRERAREAFDRLDA